MQQTQPASRGFKRKTIIQVIRAKLDAWLKTITDEELRKEVDSHVIVTGGCIPSMLQGQLPNDFDLYLDNTATAQKLADYYLKKYIKTEKVSEIKSVIEGDRVRIVVRSSGLINGEEENQFDNYQYFETLAPEESEKYFENQKKEYIKPKNDAKFKVLYISSNAITLSDDVQICLRFTGPPEEIHRNYDFLHATNYYTKSTGLVLHPEALECILAKELRYVGSKYPICSMFRIRKFIERGWTITAGEILKISYDISKLDLTDRHELQEQLVGVDAAYFHEVIQLLETGKDLDRTYLFEVISRVFDQ